MFMFEALNLPLHIQRWEQVPAEMPHTCYTSTTMEVICCEEVPSGATYGLFVASELVDVQVDGEIYECLIRSVVQGASRGRQHHSYTLNCPVGISVVLATATRHLMIAGDGELEILEPFVQDINRGRQQPGTDGECSWE